MAITQVSTNVVIVGAGPAGLGCAALLKQMGINDNDMFVIDAKTIGSSFKNWPKEMKMSTPSFPSNGFHQTDLNAITPDTSPAFSLGREHPSGAEYASYLNNVAQHYGVMVDENQPVTKVQPDRKDDSFVVSLASGTQIKTQFLIWAAGEYSTPKTNGFDGIELCRHNSSIKSWQDCEQEHYAVIGCYESGVDAAYNLTMQGKRVTLVDVRSEQDDTYDPSSVLSPYSAERLTLMANSPLVELVQDFKVLEVRKTSQGYELLSTKGDILHSDGQPINCTGFETNLGPVEGLFELDENGFPKVNPFDESICCRNLFLSGPKLVHDKVLLCFIYKYRGRFAVPCSIIGDHLGLDLSVLNHYQQAGMFLRDLSCCETQQCFC